MLFMEMVRFGSNFYLQGCVFVYLLIGFNFYVLRKVRVCKKVRERFILLEKMADFFNSRVYNYE